MNAGVVGTAAATVAVGAAAVVVAVAGVASAVVRDAALVAALVGGRGLLGLTENVVEFSL